MSKEFDMELIISKLKSRRKVFVSEADLQLEMAWTIKEEYPKAKVRLEYCPIFDFNMHIDILVIIDNIWLPIELKYKTKCCSKIIDDERFNLKNHGAKDVNCYLYLKDIQRIERIKENILEFKEGYTVFITNELSYLKKPLKEHCVYEQFSLEDEIIKTGILDWGENTSDGTKKNCEKPIKLQNEYYIKWKNYSKLDDSNTGTFMYLTNKIEK